jgi:hypothetical protein
VRILKALRNHVAHGTSGHLVMPTEAARTLSDAAKVINRLWGSSTPGGGLYPAPIQREIQLVAWDPASSVLTGPAGNGEPDAKFLSWTYFLVRAVLHDDGLSRFDAMFETTTYPCDLLWGPGRWPAARAWLDEERPEADEVDVLDRLFLLQLHDGRLFLPRSPAVAAGLTGAERQGTWYLVRADFPADAITHVRGVIAGQCISEGRACDQCAAESVGTGSWQEMIGLLASTGVPVTARCPPEAKAPSMRRWPRYFEVPGRS